MCFIDRQTSCGYGTETRNLSCLRLDGSPTDPALCAHSIADNVQVGLRIAFATGSVIYVNQIIALQFYSNVMNNCVDCRI